MFICMICGTFHEAKTVCCGEDAKPLEAAMGEQAQLFELAGNDRAQNVLLTLKRDYEGCADRVTKLDAKLEAAELARDKAEAVLIDFFRLTVSEGGAVDASDEGA